MSESAEILTGVFSDVQLSLIPVSELPSHHVRAQRTPRWERALGHLQIVMDGKTTGAHLPPAHAWWLVAEMTLALDYLWKDQDTVSRWFTSGWRFDLSSFRRRDEQVKIDLYEDRPAQNDTPYPTPPAVMRNVRIPIDRWSLATIQLCQSWLQHLEQTYPDEINNPALNQKYIVLQHMQEQMILTHGYFSSLQGGPIPRDIWTRIKAQTLSLSHLLGHSVS